MANQIIWVASSARAGGTGTEASPYATIQAAVNAAGPGTTIMVKAGVYTENVVFRTSGTASAPIELVSADGVGKAEIRPANSSADTIRVSAVNHITIDGFKVIGPSLANAIHVSSADNMTKIPAYITIKNNDIRPDAGDGVKISQGDHISILDNTVVGSTHEQGIDAVGVTHSIISGNDVSGVTGGAAIQVKGGSIDVEISYNTIHDTGRWGILVGGSTNVQNLLPGTTNFEATNVRVLGNEVDGSQQQALRVIGAQDVKVSGNWFHDVASSRFVDIVSSGDTHELWPSRNITFDNNSFDRASWLTVDSGQGQYTTTANKTDGAAPSGWVDGGAPAPAPTPTPTPTPEPTPT
ncbi:right-handed parallel beta-helix repeat-containing protein, partial [Microvirga brassicacearum]